MDIPATIRDRLASLSAECGVPLQVFRYWENEYRPGWYCRFRGTALKSDLLVIELAGTLVVELDEGRFDEVDLFVFVNGIRVNDLGPRSSGNYLHRRGSQPFQWDRLDEGYEPFVSLDVEEWRLES